MQKISFLKLSLCTAFIFFTCHSLAAQTSVFTYQGKLTDTSAAANGQYDFTFKLYDAVSGGTQIGANVFLDNVAVSGGIFTVNLDFGAASFSNGAPRFLEISVRTGTSTGAFTILAPRQPITSAPFSVRSLNSANADTSNNSLSLGGTAANQFVQTTDTRLSDDRNPLPSSPNYIQNSSVQQSSSNFNVTGNGTVGGTLTANTMRVATQYDIGVNRILSSPGISNLFAGIAAGQSNPNGNENTFFGSQAGRQNTEGNGNSFFGSRAGYFTNGNQNSSFGTGAGNNLQAGSFNSFFGSGAGFDLNFGEGNSFFGVNTGLSMVGSTGTNNVTLLGAFSNGPGNLSNATAIGAQAMVTQSNSLILGSINGINSATANTNVGIGTTTPNDRLEVNGIIRVSTLGAAGAAQLCRNALNQIATCSSSLRYKTNINSFGSGLNLVRRLSPITFDWKAGGMKDLGLGAEDVAAIEPLLVTYNDKGEVEGVKYDRVGVILINAVKEQQLQIDAQNRRNEALQKQLDEQGAIIQKQQTELAALKTFICSQPRRRRFASRKTN